MAKHQSTLQDAGTSEAFLESRAQTAKPRAPRLSLSVVIPARNEEQTIGATLERLRDENVKEVIVVDGESADQTREVARSFGATVVGSRPGRGHQMNAGAAVASGQALLFLHADTLLPRGFPEHVSQILARPGVSAGAFRLHVDAPGRSFRLLEKMVQFRSRILQYPYGDQAIFVRADLFRRVGGFPEWPVMEDLELIRLLRRIGRVEIAPASAVTSARRWLDQGFWRTTLINKLCIVAFHLGVRPTRIARWRGHPSPPFAPRGMYDLKFDTEFPDQSR